MSRTGTNAIIKNFHNSACNYCTILYRCKGYSKYIFFSYTYPSQLISDLLRMLYDEAAECRIYLFSNGIPTANTCNILYFILIFYENSQGIMEDIISIIYKKFSLPSILGYACFFLSEALN